MCECVRDVDAKLAKYNRAIFAPHVPMPVPSIETYKWDSSKPHKRWDRVLASYCPFCGVKYGRNGEENEAEKGA